MNQNKLHSIETKFSYNFFQKKSFPTIFLSKGLINFRLITSKFQIKKYRNKENKIIEIL